MKKFLLSTAVCCLSMVMYAQKAEKADPHAGHNHASPAAAPADPTSSKAMTAVNIDKAAETNDAAILVVKEELHDFGKIPQGKPVHHTFTVYNEGTTPLKITNVQASCGCTTPEWEKDKEIAPKGSTVIKVGYNAQAEGPFMKPVTITYGEGKTKVLNIKGEVWKTPATSAPENKALGEIKN